MRADAQVRTALGLPQRIGEEQRGQLEAVFQGMDTDDSRGVDVDEFVAFMRAQFGGGAARGKVEEWDEVRSLRIVSTCRAQRALHDPSVGCVLPLLDG